jgi:hypothetical protein
MPITATRADGTAGGSTFTWALVMGRFRIRVFRADCNDELRPSSCAAMVAERYCVPASFNVYQNSVP